MCLGLDVSSLNIQHNISEPEKAAQKREFHRWLLENRYWVAE